MSDSCSGVGKIAIGAVKGQTFGQCPDCGQPVVLKRQIKNGTAWYAAHGKRAQP